MAGAYLALLALRRQEGVFMPGSGSIQAAVKSVRSGLIGFATSGVGSLILELLKGATVGANL